MKHDVFANNQALVHRIGRAISSGKVSHAYIIEGASQEDKAVFTTWMIKSILCEDGRGDDCGRCPICHKIDHDNHEDLIRVEKKGMTVPIAAIRDMQTRLDTRPFGDRHIVIMEESDLMNEAAANCLLKTLEEPPGNSVLLLLSENTENLLPTIRSRCILIRLEGTAGGQGSGMQDRAEKLMELIIAGAPYYERKKAMGDGSKDREHAMDLIDCLELQCRKFLLARNERGVLYSPQQIGAYTGALEEARRDLSKGYHPGYVMKHLLLVMGG